MHACTFDADREYDESSMAASVLADSMTDISLVSRPPSSLSKVAPESWKTVSGKFIGVYFLIFSPFRLATVILIHCNNISIIHN